MWWNRSYSGWSFCIVAGVALIFGGCTQTGYVGTTTCLACHDGRSASDMGLHLSGKHARVSCESCHGAGALHVRNGGRGGLLIVNPARQSFDTAVALCAECHEAQASGFSDTLHATEKAASCHVCHDVHVPGTLHAELNNAGRADRNTYAMLCGACHDEAQSEFDRSVHAMSDAANCGTCHDLHSPHTLRVSASNNAVCQQCHGGSFLGLDTVEAVDFHTGFYHPVDPAGTGASRCTGCHMPNVDRNGIFGAGFDHTLSTIPPATTNDALSGGAIFPPANSCSGVTGCHDNLGSAGSFHNPSDRFQNEQLQVLYESIGQIPN